MIKKRAIIAFAAVSGLMMVAFGAFGAHVLTPKLGELKMSWIHTGLQYQAWHTLALLGLAAATEKNPLPTWWRRSSLMFGWGIILFSGSLYALALTQLKFFVFVTPCGGLLLLLGWLFMLVGALRPSIKADSHE